MTKVTIKSISLIRVVSFTKGLTIRVWRKLTLAFLIASMLLISACSKNTAEDVSSKTEADTKEVQEHSADQQTQVNEQQDSGAVEKNFSVENAWVRALPPSQKTTAAYLELANISTRSQTLVGVTSPVVDKIEMHLVLKDGDQMQMREVEKIAIAPATRVSFEPGGQHLMLIGLQQVLNKSEHVPLELIFDSGEHLKIEALVASAAPSESKEHSHH